MYARSLYRTLLSHKHTLLQMVSVKNIDVNHLLIWIVGINNSLTTKLNLCPIPFVCKVEVLRLPHGIPLSWINRIQKQPVKSRTIGVIPEQQIYCSVSHLPAKTLESKASTKVNSGKVKSITTKFSLQNANDRLENKTIRRVLKLIKSK